MNKAIAFFKLISPIAMPLIIMGASKFIDAEDPLHRQVCLWAYLISTLLTCAALFFIRIKISRENNQKEIEVVVKPDPWDAEALAKEEEEKKKLKPGQKLKEKRKKMTIQEYDMEKWHTHFTQKFLLPAGITIFLFRQWGYIVPLAMQALMGPQQHWGFELLQIHLLGKEAKGALERPFPELTPMEEMGKRFGMPPASANKPKRR